MASSRWNEATKSYEPVEREKKTKSLEFVRRSWADRRTTAATRIGLSNGKKMKPSGPSENL